LIYIAPYFIASAAVALGLLAYSRNKKLVQVLKQKGLLDEDYEP